VRGSLFDMYFKRVAVPLLFAAVLTSPRFACGDEPSGQGWDLCWQEDLREPESPVPLEVHGNIPAWLHGSLIRNGGAQYDSLKNNITFAFDGLAKLFKFSLHGGKAFFQERFLRTALFNATRADNKFPKSAMMGAVEPPFGMFDRPHPALSDNTNIQVFPIADGGAIATTDSAVFTTFDSDSLETTGKITPATTGLSASHLHYLPGSDNSVTINFATNILSLRNHEITVFKMGADLKQIHFGKTSVNYIPYIHSFAVTPKHMLLFAYPLGFAELCTLTFRPIIECAEWSKRNTTLFVFNLEGKADDAPVMTLELPPHFSLHHVNAFEDDEAFTVECNTYWDSATLTSKFVHADLHVMHTRSERNQIQPWSDYTRIRIDKNSGATNMDTIPLRDSDGYLYKMDFPFVNPSKDGYRQCVVWGVTSYARNSTEYSAWALLRTDVCGGETNNTIAWYEPNQYPSEPVLVPRPGGSSEDDGVLLSQVVDGSKGTTYLLLLEPKTMQELARAYLPSGWATPYTQHGRWFEAPSAQNFIV